MRFARTGANLEKNRKTDNWGLVKQRKNCYTMNEGNPETGRCARARASQSMKE